MSITNAWRMSASILSHSQSTIKFLFSIQNKATPTNKNQLGLLYFQNKRSQYAAKVQNKGR